MSFRLDQVFPITNQTIHFIGIGGIGMSGIAEILHCLGYKVQGSDINKSYITDRLENLGIRVYHSQESSNVNSCSLVIKSTDIKDNNPEIINAIELNIPIIKRSEMLAEIMRFKHSIAVSGTHGKTTTTSLVAHLLERANLDPTVINGGIINNKKTNAYIGLGEYLVAEADESDGTFINIPYYTCVVTNINPEHLNYYKNFENVVLAYQKFIKNLPFYGYAVLCYDHPIVNQIGSAIKNKRVISYGIDTIDVDLRAINIEITHNGSKFDVQLSNNYKTFKNLDSDLIKGVELQLNGVHNVSNCLAAIAIGLELKIDIKVITKAFSNFDGVKRRFTKTGESNGITIIDDYAHHPNEIKATLLAAQNMAHKLSGRVIAVVQPHRYTRLKDLINDYAEVLLIADEIIISDVYSAGEEPIVGINSLELIKRMEANTQKKIFYLEQPEKLAKLISKIAKNLDIVVLMGAGNITKWAHDLPNELQKIHNAIV